MKKTLVIARRELVVRLRKASFWVLSLLVPVVLTVLYVVPVVAATHAEHPTTVLVVDETGLFAGGLHSTDAVHFRTMPSLKYAMSDCGDADLILYIPLRETYMPREATLIYHGMHSPSLMVQSTVDNQLQQLLQSAILQDVYGLSPAERHTVESSHIALHTRDAVTGREGITRVKVIASFVLALLMALTVILFGVQVMRAVQEERQNRIVEVLATSVSPLQLLGGKMAGVALTALLQMLVWILLTVAAVAAVQAAVPDLFAAVTATPDAFDIEAVSAGVTSPRASYPALIADSVRGLAAIDMPLIAAAFVLCFLLAFLLYGGLLAALAARLDSEADVLQWSLLVCSPLLLVPLLMPLVVKRSVWLLLVPFTSPAALVAELPFGIAVPLALVALLLLAVAAAAALMLAASTYRAFVMKKSER